MSKSTNLLAERTIGIPMKYLNQHILAAIRFLIPVLGDKQCIVAGIRVEQALVSASRELTSPMVKNCQATHDHV